MSTLKTSLRALYQRKVDLENYFEFNDTYLKLNSFINSEIVDGKTFINPYKFSKIYEMELTKVLALFIFIGSIEDNRIFSIKYKYTCKNGTDSFLSESQLDNFVCDEDCYCEEEFNLREEIERGSIDVPIYFKVDSQLKMSVIEAVISNSGVESFRTSHESGVEISSLSDLKNPGTMVKFLSHDEAPDSLALSNYLNLLDERLEGLSKY